MGWYWTGRWKNDSDGFNSSLNLLKCSNSEHDYDVHTAKSKLVLVNRDPLDMPNYARETRTLRMKLIGHNVWWRHRLRQLQCSQHGRHVCKVISSVDLSSSSARALTGCIPVLRSGLSRQTSTRTRSEQCWVSLLGVPSYLDPDKVKAVLSVLTGGTQPQFRTQPRNKRLCSMSVKMGIYYHVKILTACRLMTVSFHSTLFLVLFAACFVATRFFVLFLVFKTCTWAKAI